MDIQTLLDWVKAMALKLEDIIHRIQEWFETDEWLKRLTATNPDNGEE